jgi:TPR repeat protein
MFLLGQCYTFGYGVTRDPEAGLGWYRRAAERGSREAEFELGECMAYGLGSGGRDLVEALRWWRAAARRGHGRARVKIGHCYRWGDGVAEDKALAVAWYRRALKGGESMAEVWLGECYEAGEGVRCDPVVALAHFRAAANAGDPHGMAELGRCLLHGNGQRADTKRGEYWLLRAAEHGWPAALGELQRHWFERAEQLMRAWSGAESGPESARQRAQIAGLYRQAAEKGHLQAALRYAVCLRDGWGVTVDATAARAWLQKASALADAKLALADMLYFGVGGSRRVADAVRWYELAARQSEDPYALYSVGFCLLYGEGVTVDPKAGIRWLRRAAAGGDADAGYELGLAYLHGRGVVSNPRLAMKWLRTAATLGHVAAQVFLTDLERDA